MNYYKLETVRAVLQGKYGVRCQTLAGEQWAELWKRTVNGEQFWTAVAWEDPEQILPEESVVIALHALFVGPIMLEIKGSGGLYL